MTDPIKALIEAAKRAVNAYNGNTSHHEERVAVDALAVAIAAAEARPEPDPRGVTKLREPLPGRAEIAIRVGANTMSGSCLIADIAKDVAELAGVMMRRHGEARPEPAPDATLAEGFYRCDCWPYWFKIRLHPSEGPVVWGFSVYKGEPGYRTAGISLEEWRLRFKPTAIDPDRDRTDDRHLVEMLGAESPKPAAEPSRISHFRIMLDNARAAATSGNPGAMLAICDAVEALAREVRK